MNDTDVVVNYWDSEDSLAQVDIKGELIWGKQRGFKFASGVDVLPPVAELTDLERAIRRKNGPCPSYIAVQRQVLENKEDGGKVDRYHQRCTCRLAGDCSRDHTVIVHDPRLLNAQRQRDRKNFTSANHQPELKCQKWELPNLLSEPQLHHLMRRDRNVGLDQWKAMRTPLDKESKDVVDALITFGAGRALNSLVKPYADQQKVITLLPRVRLVSP